MAKAWVSGYNSRSDVEPSDQVDAESSVYPVSEESVRGGDTSDEDNDNVGLDLPTTASLQCLSTPAKQIDEPQTIQVTEWDAARLIADIQHTPTAWGANFWVVLSDPVTGCTFYACPATGDCSWDAPVGAMVIPRRQGGEFWELQDPTKGGRSYYYHTGTGKSQWNRPKDELVIPLGMIQMNSLSAKRFSKDSFTKNVDGNQKLNAPKKHEADPPSNAVQPLCTQLSSAKPILKAGHSAGSVSPMKHFRHAPPAPLSPLPLLSFAEDIRLKSAPATQSSHEQHCPTTPHLSPDSVQTVFIKPRQVKVSFTGLSPSSTTLPHSRSLTKYPFSDNFGRKSNLSSRKQVETRSTKSPTLSSPLKQKDDAPPYSGQSSRLQTPNRTQKAFQSGSPNTIIDPPVSSSSKSSKTSEKSIFLSFPTRTRRKGKTSPGVIQTIWTQDHGGEHVSDPTATTFNLAEANGSSSARSLTSLPLEPPPTLLGAIKLRKTGSDRSLREKFAQHVGMSASSKSGRAERPQTADIIRGVKILVNDDVKTESEHFKRRSPGQLNFQTKRLSTG